MTIAIGLAGCGRGSDATSTTASTTTDSLTSTGAASTTTADVPPAALGSESAVRTAVEAVLTSSDPADACGKYVTQRYLSAAYGGKQGCVKAQAPGGAAASLRSLRITQEATQGTLVAAVAVPSGGPYDGNRVDIRLVFDADHYRVDHLHADVPVGP
jgi:hypothetical protein